MGSATLTAVPRKVFIVRKACPGIFAPAIGEYDRLVGLITLFLKRAPQVCQKEAEGIVVSEPCEVITALAPTPRLSATVIFLTRGLIDEVRAMCGPFCLGDEDGESRKVIILTRSSATRKQKVGPIRILGNEFCSQEAFLREVL